MAVPIQFRPIEDLTARKYAARLRVAAAAATGPFFLTFTPDAARALAQDLDRLVEGAGRAFDAELERIATEATEAAYQAAMKEMARQVEAAAAEITARRAQARARAIRAAWSAAGYAAILMILIGWWVAA